MALTERLDRADPQLSIVITTRDRSALVQRAVASALVQTLESMEIIVVDDGSEEPFEWSHPAVRIIRNERSVGVCAARNCGLKAARGNWTTFLDDDDELLPLMADESLKAARESELPPPVAVLSAMMVVDQAGRELGTRLPVTLPKGSHYFMEERQPGRSFQAHNALVAPTEVLREIGGWDEHMRASEHSDLFLRLNQRCSIQGIELVTYRHTDHPGPRLHSDLLARPEAMRRTVEKHRATFRLHRTAHAHYLATMGATYLRAGKWWRAVDATSRALLLDPFGRQHLIWWLASLLGPKGLALNRWLRARLVGFYRRFGSVQQGGEM